MGKNKREYSILPYLSPKQGSIFLSLTLSVPETGVQEEPALPFLLVDESDPIGRLFEARVKTDALSEIKKVFLMVERDKYLLKSDELISVNNSDVGKSWQKAFLHYTKEKRDTSLITLTDQINEKGEIMRTSPIFYCKAKQSFFHPPCPNCGLLLQQCEDDGILTGSGLQPYSQSLKRYLYCPSCASAGNYDFYVYELDQNDTSSVKNHLDLIKKFSQIARKKHPATQFPCGKCSYHEECYGVDGKVLSRIVPFSFYPFYLLIFNAMSLNALDFLPLISGAPFDEIETTLESRHESGRINCLNAIKQKAVPGTPFLYSYDERHFLEILYLKLSFLGGVIQEFLAERDHSHSANFKLSIDRVWVNLAEQSELLPFYWNFKVVYVDISRHLVGVQSLPKLPSSDKFFCLGIIWFYTLLVNKIQSNSYVYERLKTMMDQFPCQVSGPKEETMDVKGLDETLIIGEEGFAGITYGRKKESEEILHETDNAKETYGKIFNEGLKTIFQPENIYWNPKRQSINKEWLSIWERSLRLGWSLLHSSSQVDKERFGKFWQHLEDLRADVKSNLFHKGPRPSIPECTEDANDSIRRILLNIKRKWCLQYGEETKYQGMPEVIVPEVSDPDAAVIPVPIDAFTTEIIGVGGTSVKYDKKEKTSKENLQETIIISSHGPQNTSSVTQSEQSKDSDPVGKEIAPRTEDTSQQNSGKRKKIDKTEFLAKTIFLGLDKGKEKK